MKKVLLSNDVNSYKANLHCHTTVSDGQKTPEEIKEMYKEKGYSVIAYSDHEVLVPHDDLNDENFLALCAFELGVQENKEGAFAFKKACHVNVIALDRETADTFKREEFYIFDENGRRQYSRECVNKIMKTGRDKGYFVTYNHPAWNLDNYEDYMSYNNMHAMEIMNWDSVVGDCSEEYCDHQYDDLLRGGKRIFAIGTDDNHNKHNDSFGAFTVIRAEKLEYKCITDALLNGSFYCSQAPEIYEVWFEDEKIKVSCSDAVKIRFSTDSRRAKNYFPENEGEFLNGAEFQLYTPDTYVRITITDKNGKKAFTNAYFTDTFFEKTN